ncbi:hypothetical protein PSCICE_02140 [Pseudomonas cichorii]|nr:hypothetical protein PSCICE_02140 [Pseudomonas cichorii]
MAGQSRGLCGRPSDELFDIRAPHVYLVKVEGDSKQGAGIYSGDIVVVDLTLYAQFGDIAIIAINNEPVCKRLFRTSAYWCMFQ